VARIALEFDRASASALFVPLKPFTTRERMDWPLHLDGRLWMTLNTAGTPHHWLGSTVFAAGAVMSSQRFALETVSVDADAQTHPAWGPEKQSYYAWSEEILSAGDGRVFAVVADQRDLEIGQTLSTVESPAGNLVVIQHGPRLFSVYAHMQKGSAVVNVGDWVERGQPIGRVGNSGDSSQPHLHVHFTDAWPQASTPFQSFALSQGVPAVFWGAQVFRDDVLYDLSGSTPLEFDIVVGSDSAR